MRRALFAAALAAAVIYLGGRELAWRGDFMAALDGARLGHPLAALGLGGFFALRLLLLLLGLPLLVGLGLFRLTKS